MSARENGARCKHKKWCTLCFCRKLNLLKSHTHTRLMDLFTRVNRYQKGKTNPDFTKARDSEWQWHQLGHMQVCISLQADNHASTKFFYRPDALPASQPTASKHWRQKLPQVKRIIWRFSVIRVTAVAHVIRKWLEAPEVGMLLLVDIIHLPACPARLHLTHAAAAASIKRSETFVQ